MAIPEGSSVFPVRILWILNEKQIKEWARGRYEELKRLMWRLSGREAADALYIHNEMNNKREQYAVETSQSQMSLKYIFELMAS